MQLSQQETARVFWEGAKKGATRSIGYIAMLAGVAAAVMIGFSLPITMLGLGAAVLSGISTIFTVGMFSGQNALAQYHQQKHNAIYEAKLARLEGRATALEHEESLEGPVHSPKLSTILEEGAKAYDRSFAEREEERINAPTTHTLH